MRLKVLLAGIVIFLLLFLPFAVFAQTTQEVLLPKSETVNRDYFGAGQSVDVEGTVNGDAYLAGGTVLMNGTVNGDVLAAGGQITIKGTMRNLRVAGGQIVIDGKILGNVTIAGGSVTLTSGSRIDGSFVGAGGQVLLSGPIGKTVTLGAGQITMGSAVGSDISVATGKLTLSSDAKINGNVWYQSQEQAQIDKAASIAGKVTHTYPPQPEKQAPQAALLGVSLIFSLAMLLLEIVIGLLLLSLVPIYSKNTIDYLKEHVWLSLGIGILAWLLIPFLVFFLLITLIGIPLAVLVVIAVILFSYIGRIYAALFLGDWVLRITGQKRINIFAAFLVGIILFEIVSLVPFLGGLFALIMTAVGFGAVVITDRSYYLNLRTKKLI